jgi:predicted DNA-binding transcriptional regulator AlpA
MVGGLTDVAGVAALLCCSTRRVFRLLAAGSLPAPLVRRHKMVRWRVNEIRKWIRAGMPSAADLEMVTAKNKVRRKVARNSR